MVLTVLYNEATARDMERKGLAVLHERLPSGHLLVRVQTLGADHYMISVHQTGAGMANGGEWEVVFNAALDVMQAEQRGFSIS